ncbi:MAG: hypothetical protein M0P66_16075 [Salinivirgaceae bacterium]|nr:hypothetical protein [Salinivirgaceae bacterium]
MNCYSYLLNNPLIYTDPDGNHIYGWDYFKRGHGVSDVSGSSFDYDGWIEMCDYWMEHGGSISEAREATAGGGPGGASANPGYASGNGSINEDVDSFWGAKMDGYGGTMADFNRGDGIKTDNNGRSYFWVTSYALDYAKNDGYKVPEDSELLIGGTVIETKRYIVPSNGGGDGYGDTFERLMFYREIGISGSIGGRWFIPHGPASNWETFFGRWTPFIIDSGLIYDYTKNKNEK